MLELLLSMVVGSIVIAGGYSAYTVVAKQYQRISAFTEVQEGGIPALHMIARDLRMAGRVVYDNNVDPVFGTITSPITITDSGDVCCDRIAIIYDKDSTDRRRVTYFTQARTSPARNALYMDVETFTGGVWVNTIDDAIVTDYIEDLQFVGSDNNGNGDPQIVDMSMVVRSTHTLALPQTYTPPASVVGNYNYSFTDNYYREVYTSTVNVKNLR